MAKWTAHRIKLRTCLLCGKRFRSLTRPSRLITIMVENPAGTLYELPTAAKIAPEIVSCFR